MDLDHVRSLKAEVRHVLTTHSLLLDKIKDIVPWDLSGLPFAFGIRLTRTKGDYCFAIRLPHHGAWFHLLRPALSRVLKPVKKELDVQVIGPVRFNTAGVLGANPPNPGLRIGAAVRRAGGGGGTLGFFAKKEGRLGIVSCNHVLASFDKGRDGDRILGPSSVELTLDGDYPPLRDRDVNLADCAFAAFANGDSPQEPGRLNGSERLLETPVLPDKEMAVRKIGSATGLRTGKVVVKELDGVSLSVDNQLTTTFDDVIEIESDNAQRRFSNAGDSGSLVYSADLRPVGLLFADSAIGGTHNNGLSFANRFEHVTRKLEVTLEV